MKLITALTILFSDDSFLSERLQEAIQTIHYEEIRSDSILSQECVKAMRVLKRKIKKR